MKILLTTLNSKFIHSNLAIRILYALNNHHQGLSWKEFTIKESQSEVAAFCAEFDIVAFSCYIWNITQTLQVAAQIKALNPSVVILLGGPEVSYEWQEVIALPQVDYIITGEGEVPFRAFLNAYPHVEGVGSLVRKVNGQVMYNPLSTSFDVAELENIMPYAFDPPEELANKVLYIETSRGCPYKCEFCLASLDNKVRYLPDHHIKSTLLYLMQHGKTIKFLDRTFNIKRDFTIGMFTFILQNHKAGNVFQFEITADIVHPDIIRFIDEHVPPGLFRFEIGIQTVNQKANLEVSRKQDFEKTKSIIRQLQEKIDMHLDLIVGLPLDYYNDIRYSIEQVFALYPPELQLGFLKFLKGTPVREKHEQHDFIFDPMPPYQLIESKYLSKDELHKIHLVENALEIYWNKKRAPHTLRYLSVNHSIFDALLFIGSGFAEFDNRQYTLRDMFTVLKQVMETHYAHDHNLMHLAALDYYAYYKIKPGMLFPEEADAAQRKLVLAQLGLNIHTHRHVVLSLPFDLQVFLDSGTISPEPSYAVYQYTGTTAAELFYLGSADYLIGALSSRK